MLAAASLAYEELAGGALIAPPVVIAEVALATLPAVPRFGFTVGSAVKLTATFTDAATGVVVDPSVVTFIVHGPGGEYLVLTPTWESAGIYYVVQLISTAGMWDWVVESAGVAQVSGRLLFPAQSI